MEVRQQGSYCPELIAWVDKDVGLPSSFAKGPEAGAVLECAHASRADRHDSPWLIELLGSPGGDAESFGVKTMLFDGFDADRLKGAQTDFQSDIDSLAASVRNRS